MGKVRRRAATVVYTETPYISAILRLRWLLKPKSIDKGSKMSHLMQRFHAVMSFYNEGPRNVIMAGNTPQESL